MNKSLPLFLLPFFLVACAATEPAPPADEHADHSQASSVTSDVVADRLINSPRHHEWAEIADGDRTIHAWVVYPQVSENAPVVVLIHENRGLNDWARSMADQVAEAGYIAVAPDLLSGFSDEFERTSDFPDEDAARNAISELNPDQVASDLAATVAWAKTIPSANGKIASAGFCWGGSQSFNLAAQSDEIDAALVFYGTGPKEPETYADIDVPVFGFYGGADQRVNATIETSETLMSQEEKSYEYVIYEGAGHAFMRLGEQADADPANAKARTQALQRMDEILSSLK